MSMSLELAQEILLIRFKIGRKNIMEENKCKCGKEGCDGETYKCGEQCECNKPKTEAEELLDLGVAPV